MKAITAENLSKIYESGTVAVDGISFSLYKPANKKSSPKADLTEEKFASSR